MFIRARVGTMFTVGFIQNGSTGYEWGIREVTGIVGIVDVRVEPPTDEGVGAPGKKIYDLAALEVGTVSLVFEHKRRWETEAIEKETLVVEVVPGGPGAPV